MENQAISLHLNLHNFIIVSGILQSFIISIILFFLKKTLGIGSKLLATALLIINLHLFSLLLIDLDLEVKYPYLLWFPWNYITALGPIIYFFTLSQTDENFTLTKKCVPHFIPVLIELMIHLREVINSIHHTYIPYKSPLYFPIHLIIYLWAGLSTYYYLGKSLQLIKKHEQWSLNNFSNLKEITLDWLLQLFQYFRYIWLCWIPFVIMVLIDISFNIGHLIFAIMLYLLAFCISYLSYWIGLQGLFKMNFEWKRQASVKPKSKSYAHLSDEQTIEYLDKIKYSMNREEFFKDENLTLRTLSKKINIEPNLISYLINSYLNQNFFEYINSYRVAYVKEKLVDPQFQHYKIIALAYEAGFSSKATFNRVFKKQVGISPIEFKKQSGESLDLGS